MSIKKDLQLQFHLSVEKNISDVLPYYETRLSVMAELTNLRNEILNCLLLGFYQGSIFSTNHFLERLIKVSLIKKHTIGYNYLNSKAYNEKIEESKLLFDRLSLSESLKKAKEKKLITEEEMDGLSVLRKTIRNPFSHAEVSKINSGSPKFFKGFMFNFDEIKSKLATEEALELPELTEISTFSPAFAQIYQEENSKLLAFDYFREVHEIMLKMEGRLTDKFQTGKSQL